MLNDALILGARNVVCTCNNGGLGEGGQGLGLVVHQSM